MNVVMVHPQHGAKVATLDLEIEQDVKNGWTRYNADTSAQEVAAPEEKPKRKISKKVTDQPVEQPNEVPDFLTSASDESEGE